MRGRGLTGIVTWGMFVAVSQTALAQSSPSSRNSLARAGASGVSQRQSQTVAWDLLRKPIEKVDWVESTFEEVISWLTEEGEENVNILPRWTALSQESVTRDTLVTLQIRDSSVSEILDETLDQVCVSGQCTYRAVGNKIRISTKTDFGRKLEVRTYDVLDLLFLFPDLGRNAPTIDLQAASRQGGSSGGGGGGQSVFGGGSSNSQQDLQLEDEEMEQELNDLIATIQAVIEPTTWKAVGGAGDIQTFSNRVLVVRNTIEVHEKIAGAFALGN